MHLLACSPLQPPARPFAPSVLFPNPPFPYSPFWPRKDLVIRTYLSEKIFLLYSLLTSVELMWPRGIGRVVVVLDEGDDVAMHLMPPWVQVKYERNYLKLPGKILQQWSYGWVDNYTLAPFVAIADDDIIFNLKVTPFLLFNLSDPSQGRPYLIGSKDQGYHRPSTDFLLGRRAYAGNFMVQLPLLLPRGAVRGYREAVGAAHPKMAGGYDEAVQWWAEHGGQYRDQIAHTVMGNYLWNNERDKMEFALEWTDHTPIPRVGVHLPYTNLFKDLGGSPVDPGSKLNLSFVQTAAHYQRETICHSLPPGELEGCEGVQPQTHIWRYAWDRQRWRQLRKRGAGTQIYDRHIRELHCIYQGMARLVGDGGVGSGGDGEEDGRSVVLVEEAVDSSTSNARHRGEHTREHATRGDVKGGRGGVGTRNSCGAAAGGSGSAACGNSGGGGGPRSPRQDSGRQENRFKSRDADDAERERRAKKVERSVGGYGAGRADSDARLLSKPALASSGERPLPAHHDDEFESDSGHHTPAKDMSQLSHMGVRREEGSPVSVLDVGMRRSDESDSEGNSGELFADRSVNSVSVCYPDATVALRQPSPASLASPSQHGDVAMDLLRLSPQDIVGDVAGMEQDLEYVRHVLLISGFGGPSLPPIFSRNLPINPVVFEQLEFEITGQLSQHFPSSLSASSLSSTSPSMIGLTSPVASSNVGAATGASAGAVGAGISRSPSPSLFPLPSFAVGAQNTSEERRQRMLLFDAVNEALGRTLAPHLEELQARDENKRDANNRGSGRPSQLFADTTNTGSGNNDFGLWGLDNGASFFASCCSASRKPALLRPRPIGRQLLQRVWAEVHSWPVAPSDDVYDILDDAARRDMVRGTERWSAEEVAAAEVPQVVFALESAVLERALEEICREFAEVEEERTLSRQRRLSANGAAEGVCAGKASVGGLRKGGGGNERRWLPRRLNF
ncbi:unnamed protein product [Closterium sp. Yama58-4]|nr:unnamed protein product [Closterium sp. Yama58-4]